MRTRWLGLVLMGAAAAAQSVAPGPTPAAAPAWDKTQSDPAALGFLEGVVDQRVYSLHALGAGKATSTLHATVEGATNLPLTFDFELSLDYTTGSISHRPLSDPPPELLPMVPVIYNYSRVATLVLPSLTLRDFVVGFVQESDGVRLDCKARAPNSAVRKLVQWYRPDGTPTKVRAELLDAAGNLQISESLPIYEEVDGRALFKGYRPVDQLVTEEMDVTYQQNGAFRVAKHADVRSGTLTIALDFKTSVSAKPKD